jgi:hypothetical protein
MQAIAQANSIIYDTYLFVEFFVELLKASETTLFHGLFGKAGPKDHVDGKDSLTLPSHDPIISARSLSVVLEGFFYNILDRLEHDLFHLTEPIFDGTLGSNWVNNSSEGHMLTFRRVHTMNLLLFIEFEGSDTFEALFKMRLYSEGFLSLRQDFKEFTV